MKSLLHFLTIRILLGSMVLVSCMVLSLTPVTAQVWYPPYVYGNALPNYGLLGGGIDPLFGGYYSSPFSPMNSTLQYYCSMSPYNVNYYLSQINAVYNYLNYALHFYELASQTPLLYLQDLTADYIGANLYNYAGNIGVSPQESIIYFIQENVL